MWLADMGASAQLPPEPKRIWLVVDEDDDDANGSADRTQPTAVPVDDLVAIPADWIADVGAVSVVGNAARLVQDGVPCADGWRPGVSGGPLRLQGLRLGASKLRLHRDSGIAHIPVQVVRLSLLDAQNRRLDPVEEALQISRRVTNDPSLPKTAKHEATSADRRNFRAELVAPKSTGRDQPVHLMSMRADGVKRGSLATRLRRTNPRAAFRSRFLRLVSDRVDEQAPGVADQVLQAGLRDRVRVAWRSPAGWLSQDIYVGATVGDKSDSAVLLARLNVLIMRMHVGGPPVIGRDDLSALAIAREQMRAANEAWAQCGITFGVASEAMISVVAPPPPSLISVADGDGLPARGDGVVQLRVDGMTIGPLALASNAKPIDTALIIADAIRQASFSVRVTRNPRTQFGVHDSADLLVRNVSGELAMVTSVDDLPLSSDSRQKVRVGSVDLSDGLEEFSNMNARAGSLEERALIKALTDDDPTTIDLVVINHFTHATRQGEAFIEASGGSVTNAVVLDRNGLRQRNSAWTLAHEIGHVLLDEPLHPDNLGPDRPWLLMDSDSNRGTVYGPKRVTADECTRARFESGPDAKPALLTFTR